MSAWSAVASAALLVVLAYVAVGQPVWEWRVDRQSELETWSYGLVDARHTIYNKTTRTVTTAIDYPYPSLPNQPNMAFALQEFAMWFILGLSLAAGGSVLAMMTVLRRLRGLYAGLALVGCCAPLFLASIGVVYAIPAAASADMPAAGQPPPSFTGQLVLPQSGYNVVFSWGPAFGWFLPLGMTLIAAFGASEVWGIQVKRKRKGTGEGAAAAGMDSLAAPLQAVPLPPGPTPSPELEEVFLISSSGLLVKHLSRSLMTDKDRDVVGGMISVVSNFVREAFSERDGDVQEVTLGQHRFVLCSQERLVVAVLARRGDTRGITELLRRLLSRLIERYGERITEWEGQSLEGIEDELAILWDPVVAPPPPSG